jgi:hypothetical protein
MDDGFKLFFWELKFVLVEIITLEMQRVSIYVVKDWIRIQCQCLICDLSQVNVMLLSANELPNCNRITVLFSSVNQFELDNINWHSLHFKGNNFNKNKFQFSEK